MPVSFGGPITLLASGVCLISLSHSTAGQPAITQMSLPIERGNGNLLRFRRSQTAAQGSGDIGWPF